MNKQREAARARLVMFTNEKFGTAKKKFSVNINP